MSLFYGLVAPAALRAFECGEYYQLALTNLPVPRIGTLAFARAACSVLAVFAYLKIETNRANIETIIAMTASGSE
jgi:hypothetical protein